MTEKKKKFLQALLQFLSHDVGGKSILLEMERTRSAIDPRPCLAKEWDELREAAGIAGYMTPVQAREHLLEILN